MTKLTVLIALSLVTTLAAGGSVALTGPAGAAPPETAAMLTASAVPGSPSLAQGRGDLGEFGQIIDATYESLSARVRPSGYAPTSVNGGYAGMFARDASIQSMAMLAGGEPEKARSVLQYIIGYGTADGLDRAPRFLPEERYRETVVVPVDPRSQSQLDADGSAFRVTNGNRLAQPFVLADDELHSVHISPWADAGATGSLEVTVRTERDGTVVAHGSVDAATLPTEQDSAWRQVPLLVDRPDLVVRGADYVLQLDSARATQRIAVNGSASVVSPPGPLHNFEDGAWRTPGHSLAFAVNTMDVPEPMHPTDVVASVGGRAIAEQSVALDATLGSLDLHVGASDGAEGDVLVSVSDVAGRTRSVAVPVEDLPADGDWVHATFPSLGVVGSSVYTVRVSAPRSAPGSIQLRGVSEEVVEGRLVVQDGPARTAQRATLALRAGSLETTGESMEDQPDGNYMVVLAWSRYVRANPQDTAFRDETYETIARWADYYLSDAYWNDETNPRTGKPMNLLYNPMLEHSRKQVHLRAYDLITNVFASQALHELAEVAQQIPGAQERAQAWSETSYLITRGIQDNLVVEREIDGEVQRVYREMYEVAPGGLPEKLGALSAYDGYTWVNLAPVAADWYAIDDDVMEATYRGYLEEGSHEWEKADGGTMTMLNACSSVGPDTGGTCNDAAEVITKGLGWEFALTSRMEPSLGAQRLAVLSDFVVEKTPDNHLLQESFYPDGRPKDAGNQEQTSWWVLGVLQAYPRTAVTPGTPSIEGDTDLGRTLIAEPGGGWMPADVALTYRWYADGVLLAGMDAPELVLTHDLLGHRISVAVTGSAPGHDTITAWSTPTEPVALPAGTPTNDAALSTLTVDGSDVVTFDPERPTYTVKALSGARAPAVAATPRSVGATVEIEPAMPATGTTTVQVTSADRSASRTYEIVIEEAAAEARPRCLAGKAYLAVRVTNPSGGRTDVRMSTPFGDMSRQALSAGKSAHQLFAVRSTGVAAGDVTITLRTTDATTSSPIPFDALDCR